MSGRQANQNSVGGEKKKREQANKDAPIQKWSTLSLGMDGQNL